MTNEYMYARASQKKKLIEGSGRSACVHGCVAWPASKEVLVDLMICRSALVTSDAILETLKLCAMSWNQMA